MLRNPMFCVECGVRGSREGEYRLLIVLTMDILLLSLIEPLVS